MRNVTRFICGLGLWLCLCGLLGCSPQRATEISGAPQLAREIKSTADLERFLVFGVRTNEIRQALGPPRWIEDLGEDRQVWHFGFEPFPADNEMRGTYVTGVAVGFTNGCLANWGCSYMGNPGDFRSSPPAPRNEKTPVGSPQLEFFIISKEPIVGGQSLDSELIKGPAFRSGKADLVVRKLDDLTCEREEKAITGSGSGGVWRFSLQLTPDDATKLGELTKANISKHVLISVGGKRVSAPKIVAPLETGTLVIEHTNAAISTNIQLTLEAMLPSKR